ncbi:hypothetical protein AVEN_81926-1 [Araneus ventricosus]|uniref:Uncharacterized protein n=1 Tax=Araneus ventricosus TaxID=182803 RepID=A0A4Y2GIG9_ARAVE|nr:hypothetical protein AVEN_81926-1 [Araneus ventricosus]
MSPLTLMKSRASKGSVSKVSLDRRRQERMCSGDALATPHFAQTGKTLLPWLKEQLLRRPLTNLDSAVWSLLSKVSKSQSQRPNFTTRNNILHVVISKASGITHFIRICRILCPSVIFVSNSERTEGRLRECFTW